MRIRSMCPLMSGTMLLTACSAQTPFEPLTVDSIEGTYTLARVAGKQLPVSFGVCFFSGCARVSTVTAGTFQIGSHIDGRWKATIVEVDDLNAERMIDYIGRDATVESSNIVLLWLENPRDPSMNPLRAVADPDVFTVIIDHTTYEFQKTK
jgi:hypothetical protein